LASTLIERPADSAFMAAALTTILLLVSASIAILHFEALPEATIQGRDRAGE
jgi:hypothetical protein